MQHLPRPILLFPALFAASVGCQVLGGLGDLHFDPASSGGSGGIGGDSVTNTTSSSSSGMGGSGGAGGSAPTSVVWAKSFGDAGQQYITDVAVDANENIFVVGSFLGQIDFGSGTLLVAPSDYDAFIAKFDKDGNELWSRRFGGAGPDRVESITLTAAGDPIIGGSFNGAFTIDGTNISHSGGTDGFVFKLSSTDGSLQWSSRFGDAQDQRCAAVTIVPNTSDVICLGDFAGTVAFGANMQTSAGLADIILIRYSSAGAFVSQLRYGDALQQTARSAIATGSSNLYIAAAFEGSISWNGAAVTSAGKNDVFLGKYQPDGALSWNVRMGDGNIQRPTAIRDVPGGGTVVVGAYEGAGQFGNKAIVSKGGYDAFVTRLDASGNALWVRSIGDGDMNVTVDAQEAMDVVAADDGSIFVTGYAAGAVDFGDSASIVAGDSDLFLMRLDADGQTVWKIRAGSSDPQVGRAIALSGAEHIIVAGDFRGMLDLGNGPLSSAGSYDIFIAKMIR